MKTNEQTNAPEATKEWFEGLRQRKKENDDETMDSFVQVHEALNSNKQ